ncbi:unnamed protein product, partial [Ectocarpus sp. 12 AP-2014]
GVGVRKGRSSETGAVQGGSQCRCGHFDTEVSERFVGNASSLQSCPVLYDVACIVGALPVSLLRRGWFWVPYKRRYSRCPDRSCCSVSWVVECVVFVGNCSVYLFVAVVTGIP